MSIFHWFRVSRWVTKSRFFGLMTAKSAYLAKMSEIVNFSEKITKIHPFFTVFVRNASLARVVKYTVLPRIWLDFLTNQWLSGYRCLTVLIPEMRHILTTRNETFLTTRKRHFWQLEMRHFWLLEMRHSDILTSGNETFWHPEMSHSDILTSGNETFWHPEMSHSVH